MTVIHLVASGTVERSTMQDVLSIYVPSFFIFLGMSIISPILPLYAKTFDVSFTLVSLAISMYAFGRFLADLPVGVVADQFGRKPLMVVGTLLLTVTAFMNAQARNFWEFLFYRLIQGLGSSMWMTSRTTLLADILKPEERGRIMSYFQAFMLLGSSAGPTIGGLVATWWGIRAPFYFYALTGLISSILTLIWIKEPKGVREKHSQGHSFSPQAVRRLLSNRSYSMACLATFTVFFMRTGIRGTMIPLYADGVLGLDESSIGTVISFATIINLIMTIPVGYAIDYFGRKPPIIASLVITALSSYVFPQTSNYVQISLAAVLLGIGTSGAGQAPLALATDATIDEPHGLSMGLYRLFGDIGFVVGPIILGMIADGYGLRMPFYFMTGLILISAVLLQVFARETYSRRKSAEVKAGS
ncbi:MAG: MFS transporter [Candidatus Bathyarchaeota archaeon]|nr:MFS transporter [Candidatus Bathyarchaeota archaeon]MDH5791600.1 MFS transporter [Candidatus Bathyarchaeota archaeon]